MSSKGQKISLPPKNKRNPFGAVHKPRWQLGEVKKLSKLSMNSTKKLLTWGRGLSKIGKKLPTSYMDGPFPYSALAKGKSPVVLFH